MARINWKNWVAVDGLSNDAAKGAIQEIGVARLDLGKAGDEKALREIKSIAAKWAKKYPCQPGCAPGAASKAESTPKSKTAPKAEAKPKAAPKAEASKSEAKPKTAPKAETPKSKTKPKTDSAPKSKTAPKAAAPKSEAKPKAAPKAEAPKSEPKPKTAAPKSEAKPKTGSTPNSKAAPKAEAPKSKGPKAEAKPKSEAKPKTAPKSKAAPKAEAPKSEPKAAPKSKSASKSKAPKKPKEAKAKGPNVTAAKVKELRATLAAKLAELRVSCPGERARLVEDAAAALATASAVAQVSPEVRRARNELQTALKSFAGYEAAKAAIAAAEKSVPVREAKAHVKAVMAEQVGQREQQIIDDAEKDPRVVAARAALKDARTPEAVQKATENLNASRDVCRRSARNLRETYGNQIDKLREDMAKAKPPAIGALEVPVEALTAEQLLLGPRTVHSARAMQ